MNRKTIKNVVSLEGIGLHKGEKITLTLKPALAGEGITFKRVDLEEGKNLIEMNPHNTFDLTRGTNLKNEFGASIYTVEHFLSAVAIKEITDLKIEVDGNESPICDGSAIEFLELLDRAEVIELEEKLEPIVIKEPLSVTNGDKHLVILPYDGYKVTYSIRFEHSFLKSQLFEIDLNEETYKKEISRARTFGFDYEVEYLKKNNLALGGSLDNAIVIKKDGVLNPDGLRYEDEFVRHKILDIIGDLKIINRPIKGHLIAVKSGHALNADLAKKLLKN